MTIQRLDNASWGFASNCFVCEPSNDRGLQIPFFYDDELDLVTAEFALDAAFSGAPSYVHGGLTLAILDEAMAWTTIASRKAFAVTRTTTTTFFRPIKIGSSYHVESRIVGDPEGDLLVGAQVSDRDGKRCAEAEARFAVLSADQAAAAIGARPGGDDAGYVKG